MKDEKALGDSLQIAGFLLTLTTVSERPVHTTRRWGHDENTKGFIDITEPVWPEMNSTRICTKLWH